MLNLPDADLRPLPATPLVLVLVQVQFGEPVPSFSQPASGQAVRLALDGSHDQRRFRMDRVTIQSVNMAFAGGPSPAAPRVEEVANGWRFEAEGGLTVSLAPDALTIETTAYTGWSDFRSEFQQALEAVLSVADVELSVGRLGHRMVNNIHDSERLGTAIAFRDRALQAWLHGPLADARLQDGIDSYQQQFDLKVDADVSATVRTALYRDVTNRRRLTYLLDFDVYRRGYELLDLDLVLSHADALNQNVVQLFHASVTSELLDWFRDGH